MQLDLGAMNVTASVTGTNLLNSGPGINLLNFAKFSLKYLLSVPHGGCSKVGMSGHLQSHPLYTPYSRIYTCIHPLYTIHTP